MVEKAQTRISKVTSQLLHDVCRRLDLEDVGMASARDKPLAWFKLLVKLGDKKVEVSPGVLLFTLRDSWNLNLRLANGDSVPICFAPCCGLPAEIVHGPLGYCGLSNHINESAGGRVVVLLSIHNYLVDNNLSQDQKGFDLFWQTVLTDEILTANTGRFKVLFYGSDEGVAVEVKADDKCFLSKYRICRSYECGVAADAGSEFCKTHHKLQNK